MQPPHGPQLEPPATSTTPVTTPETQTPASGETPVWADPIRVLQKLAGTLEVAERTYAVQMKELDPTDPRFEFLRERLQGRIDAYRDAINDVRVAAYAVTYARARAQNDAMDTVLAAAADERTTHLTTHRAVEQTAHRDEDRGNAR